MSLSGRAETLRSPAPTPLGTRIVSSSVGSAVAALALTPVDVAKVRLQNLGASAVRCCAAARGPAGTFAMVRQIFVKEGLVGAYAGLKPTLLMTVPCITLYFSTYDEILWGLRTSLASNESWMPLVAGGSARFVASSVTAPFEYMRTRLAASSTTAAAASGRNQQQQARRPGLWEEFHSVVRKKGFGTLYRGLQSTLWRDVPFASIYWFVMEHNKTKFGVYEHLSSSEQVAFAFVNGTVSSVVAVACTTPFDLVKSRQQAAGLQQSPLLSRGITQSLLCHRTLSLVQAAENREAMMLGSAGTFEYMKHIVRSEGVPGLWRGNVARMLRVVPGYAILISTYELGKQILVAE